MKPRSTSTWPMRRPPADPPDLFAAVGFGAGAFLLAPGLAGAGFVGGCLPAVGLTGGAGGFAPGLAGVCGLAGTGLPIAGLPPPGGTAAGLPGAGGPLGFLGG